MGTTIIDYIGGTIYSIGNDTVQMYFGSSTIFASGPSILVNGPVDGSLFFVGGGGSDTVNGGFSGNDTIFGGTGGGYFAGGSGGNNIILAGSGNTTLAGGGNGDLIFASTQDSGDVLKASFGQEELIGGAGATTMVGGTVENLLYSGPNVTYMFAGSGQTVFMDGGANANDQIIGFKQGIDKFDLNGQTVSTENTGNYGTILSLRDGTSVTFYGVSIAATDLENGA